MSSRRCSFNWEPVDVSRINALLQRSVEEARGVRSSTFSSASSSLDSGPPRSGHCRRSVLANGHAPAARRRRGVARIEHGGLCLRLASNETKESASSPPASTRCAPHRSPEDQIVHQSTHDDHRSANRTHFWKTSLQTRRRSDHGGVVGMVMMDFDRFKEINAPSDTTSGDTLLIRSAPSHAYAARPRHVAASV